MPKNAVRRSGRITKQVPLLLIGSNAEGRVFTEEACTSVLSLHGAGILCASRLHPDQELVLRSLESNREANVRIIGEIGTEDGKSAYGVAFTDEQLDFWNVDFVAPYSSSPPPAPLYLECSHCNSPLHLEDGDFEFDVCAIHGGLVRFCNQCRFTTVWKVTAPSAAKTSETRFPGLVLATEPSDFIPSGYYSAYPEENTAVKQDADVALATVPSAVPTAGCEPGHAPDDNRRLHRRAKVNYCACVRSEIYGDDIVNCLDMSRGGVAFRTKNPYLLAGEVRIAVPFSRESPDAPAIFVSAKIATRNVLADGKSFRCGVAFISQWRGLKIDLE
jgi:hypothetical protein